MALSENARDFWIAAAAAAPIIALAGLVAISDAAVTGDMIKRARKDHPGLCGKVIRGKEVLGPPSWWVSMYNIFNLLTQGFVLIVALLALLHDGTPISGIWIIVMEAVGLFFLLVAAYLAGQTGAESQRWDEALTRCGAEQLAEAIASKFRQLQLASRSQETVAAEAPENKPEGTGALE